MRKNLITSAIDAAKQDAFANGFRAGRPQWRPISTAPRGNSKWALKHGVSEGPCLLVMGPREPSKTDPLPYYVMFASWHRTRWFIRGSHADHFEDPEWWMPIPDDGGHYSKGD